MLISYFMLFVCMRVGRRKDMLFDMFFFPHSVLVVNYIQLCMSSILCLFQLGFYERDLFFKLMAFVPFLDGGWCPLYGAHFKSVNRFNTD